MREKIFEDLKMAQKQGLNEKVSVLRLLVSAIYNKEIEKRALLRRQNPGIAEEQLSKQGLITDSELGTLLVSEVKKRKDAAELYTKGGRVDLTNKERKEIEILSAYLPQPSLTWPQQMSHDEIRAEAKKVISEIKATDAKDIGKTIGILMGRLRGRAEGAAVSEIVKELLQKRGKTLNLTRNDAETIQ